MTGRQFVFYARKKDHTPFGAVVGIERDDRIDFGWSVCCPRDRFTKKRAKEIALARAERGRCENKMPDRLWRQMRNWVWKMCLMVGKEGCTCENHIRLFFCSPSLPFDYDIQYAERLLKEVS